MNTLTPADATKDVRLTQGTVRYREYGRGAPLLFVHGLLVNGALWRKVAPPLAAAGYRCIVPDWPLGAHSVPMRPGADLTPPGIARLIAEFISALDLTDVTIVGNDTGGAFCQIAVTEHPERIARLVLTNCDAFENFLPPLLRPFQWGARVPGFVALVARLIKARAARRLLFALVAKHPVPAEVEAAYLRPLITDAAVRRDLTAVLRGISPRYTLTAAEKLGGFPGPVLLAWAPEDRLFSLKYAERLRARFRDARLQTVPDSYAFISEDQPERLVDLIAAFLRETDALPAGSGSPGDEAPTPAAR